MQTVQTMIEKSGGFARLKRRPIRIDNGEHPSLVIQYLGKTCNPALSVTHPRQFK